MPSHTLVEEQYCGDNGAWRFVRFKNLVFVTIPAGGSGGSTIPGGGSTTESGCTARLNVLISRSSSVKIPATDKMYSSLNKSGCGCNLITLRVLRIATKRAHKGMQLSISSCSH